MDLNKENIERLWNKESYYKLIEDSQGEGSEFVLSNIVKILRKYSSKEILDVGCGEGSIIAGIISKISEKLYCKGVDVAEIGIQHAKKRGLQNCEFKVYDGITIPYEAESFDLCFSTFVFEHLQNPERTFSEMVRVVKRGGIVTIICPNYGSPFFRSPCNNENKVALMLKRLMQSFIPRSSFADSFKWNKVEPIIKKDDVHVMDHDTTVEPNLLFFKKFLTSRSDLEIVEIDSFWNEYEYAGSSRLKNYFLRLMAYLGKIGMPIIKYYGPFFYVSILKK